MQLPIFGDCCCEVDEDSGCCLLGLESKFDCNKWPRPTAARCSKSEGCAAAAAVGGRRLVEARGAVVVVLLVVAYTRLTAEDDDGGGAEEEEEEDGGGAVEGAVSE